MRAVLNELEIWNELPNLKSCQNGIDLLGQESLGKNTTVAPSSSGSTAVVHGTTNETSSEPIGPSSGTDITNKTIQVPMNETVAQEKATESIDDQLETKSVDSEISGFSDFSQWFTLDWAEF